MRQIARKRSYTLTEQVRDVLLTRIETLGDIVFDYDADALTRWLATPTARVACGEAPHTH